MAHLSKRHSGNSNLHLHHENTFRGLRVMRFRGPLITEYLERLYETTQLALSDHRRVFALRFDLRFPDDYLPPASGNAVISRFVDSLSARIESARERLRLLNGTAHQTQVRWFGLGRQVRRDGRITTSYCCSTRMRITPWGASIQGGRIYTAAFSLQGRVH